MINFPQVFGPLLTWGWMVGMESSCLVSAAGMLAAGEKVRNYSLVLGLIGIVVGIALLLSHKRIHDEAMQVEDNDRAVRFEKKKFRRRAVVSAMIASSGCMLASLYWVNDPKIFSIFILLILSTLLCVLAIAIFDMFSVGLRSLTRTDDAARKALVEEYLRQRKKASMDDPENSSG